MAPVSPTVSEPNWVEYSPDSADGRCLFSRLVHGVSEGEDFTAGDAVFDRLFRLIKNAATGLQETWTSDRTLYCWSGVALFFAS